MPSDQSTPAAKKVDQDKLTHELGLIANRVNVLICSISAQGFFTAVNPYWETILGWSHQEMLTHPFSDFLHPDDLKSSLAVYQRLLAGYELVNFRNRYRHKQGHYIWLQWAATISLETSDAVIMASAQVITNTVELEQRAADYSDLFAQAASMGKIGHWSIDFVTHSVKWSSMIYEIHGVSEDTYSPTLESAIGFYHPDDIARVEQAVEEALIKGCGWSFTLRIVRPDGNVRTVKSIAKISRDHLDRPQSIIGVFQDITDYVLLNSRVELLSKVAETSTAGVVICDAKRRVLWANEAFEKISQYSLAEVEGETLGQYLQGPETSLATVENIKRTLASGCDVNVEILNYRKDGQKYWNHLFVSPIKKDGVITNFIGLQHDITKRIKQQESISRNQKMTAIGKLAAGICHDFNNIMAIISGNTQLLRMVNKEPKLDKFIDNLESATERASSVTKRLLKTVKNEDVKPEKVYIDQELVKTIAMLKDSIPSGITLHSQLNAKIAVVCNKSTVLDSVINMIINARNAIDEDGDIIIRTFVMPYAERDAGYLTIVCPRNEGRCVAIQIEDSGRGIPPNDLKTIFDPFFTTRTNKNGVGLGLSLLFDHATDEGIGVTVSSVVDQGTTFCLWLPV